MEYANITSKDNKYADINNINTDVLQPLENELSMLRLEVNNLTAVVNSILDTIRQEQNKQ